MTAVFSWINKGQPTIPEWISAKMVDRRAANGSFLIEGKHGRLRVHAGAIVFQFDDELYTCETGEAKAMLAGLQEAAAPVPPRPSNQPQLGSLEADVADRTDDTDDITRALRGTAVAPPRMPPVPIHRPPVSAVKPAPPSARTLPAKGSMPSIEWMQLDRLKVDDAYQRSVDTGPSRALIARIGREWDWRLCVPLMVSRRDDGLFVIDGQHRLQGARRRKDVPQLPCCISVYEGPEAEAAMFVAANRERRAMNRLDDFHAAQASRNPDALAVTALIEGVGFTVSRKTGSAAWAPGEVAFTSAIAKARRRHGEDVAREALELMAEAFPGQRLIVGSSIFAATVGLLTDRPADFTRDRALAALRTFDMAGWGTFIANAKGGSDRAKALKDMLRAAYDDVGRERAA